MPQGTMLDTIRRDWVARGWDLADLGTYRMDQAALPIAEPAPAAPAPSAPAPAPAPAPTSGPPPAPAAPPPPTGEPPAPAAEPGAPTGNEPPPWEGKSPQELWELNSKLRDENVRYKERFRPWEELTADLHPDDVSVVRDLLGGIKQGQVDPAIAADFRAVLDKMTPAQQAAAAQAVEEAAAFDPLDPNSVSEYVSKTTQEAVQRALAERDEQAAIERNIASMNEHLKGLGETLGIPELGDPTSDEYALVLSRANRMDREQMPDPMERLKTAAESFRDNLDKRAQALLKAKVPGADAPPAAPPGGAEPTGREKPTDPNDLLKIAARSGRERIDKILGGRVGE